MSSSCIHSLVKKKSKKKWERKDKFYFVFFLDKLWNKTWGPDSFGVVLWEEVSWVEGSCVIWLTEELEELVVEFKFIIWASFEFTFVFEFRDGSTFGMEFGFIFEFLLKFLLEFAFGFAFKFKFGFECEFEFIFGVIIIEEEEECEELVETILFWFGSRGVGVGSISWL